MGAIGITKGAAMAINDLLDNCLEVKPGDEVVIASHVDGMYGGDNLVDPPAVAWIQAAIEARALTNLRRFSGIKAPFVWIVLKHVPPMR